VNFHCWPMTWMGSTVFEVGVQMGFGPCPPPAPSGLDELVGAESRQEEHEDRRDGDPTRLDLEVVRRERPSLGSGPPFEARHLEMMA